MHGNMSFYYILRNDEEMCVVQCLYKNALADSRCDSWCSSIHVGHGICLHVYSDAWELCLICLMYIDATPSSSVYDARQYVQQEPQSSYNSNISYFVFAMYGFWTWSDVHDRWIICLLSTIPTRVQCVQFELLLVMWMTGRWLLTSVAIWPFLCIHFHGINTSIRVLKAIFSVRRFQNTKYDHLVLNIKTLYFKCGRTSKKI